MTRRPPAASAPARIVSLLRLRKLGGFARNAMMLSAATAIGQGLIVVTSPLITRLYDPASFGELAIFVSIVSTVSSLGALNYDVAIPLPDDDQSAADLMMLALTIVMGVALTLGLAIWIWGDLLGSLIRMPTMSDYAWLFALSLAGAAGYRTVSYWAIRKEEFGRIARTKISQSISQVGLQIGFGLAGAGTVGLLVGDAMGRTAGAGTISSIAWRKDKKSLRATSLKGMAAAASRYRRFPLFLTGSVLLNNAGQNLPALMVAGIFGPQVVGWFALSERVIAVPMRVVGRSIAQVYIGRAAQLSREDPAALTRLFKKTTLKLLLVGVPPLLLIAIAGPSLFDVIFGNRWEEAGEFTRLLAVGFLLQFIAVPVSQSLNVIERQDLQLAWDILKVSAVVASFAAAVWLGWSSRTTIVVYAISMVVTYGLLLILTSYALTKHANALVPALSSNENDVSAAAPNGGGRREEKGEDR